MRHHGVVTTPSVPLQAPSGPRLGFLHAGFGNAAVDYAEGWELQRRLHAQRVADVTEDVVVLLEHQSVYTAGKRTEAQDRPLDGTPVVEVDRGGKITWHGPGQLVGYPITKLPPHVYVVDYVRRLEEALIRVCGDFGVATGRIKGRSGVWVAAQPADQQVHDSYARGDRDRPSSEDPRKGRNGIDHSVYDHKGVDRKVAALGVRVSRGVTMHGLAFNCDNAMTAFDAIVPCGIVGAGVTTLSAELGRAVTVAEALPLVERHLADLLSWAPYERTPDLPSHHAAGSPGARTQVTYGLQPLS